MDVMEILTRYAPLVEREIEKILPRDIEPWAAYSLIWDFLDRGGKRFRPAMCMLACEAVGGKKKDALQAAAALEMFHNFCLPGSAKVLTGPGKPKSISELTPGEEVYTFDKGTRSIRKSKVLALVDNGVRDVYRLRTNNREITATANHPFLTVTKEHPIQIRLTDSGREKIRQAARLKGVSLNKLSSTLVLPASSRNWWTSDDYLISPERLAVIASYLGVDFSKDDLQFVKSNIGVEAAFKWKRLYDLRTGDMVVISTGIPDEGKRKSIALPAPSPMVLVRDKVRIPAETTGELCQLAGMFLGDGCVSKSKKSSRFYLCIPEQQGELRAAYSQLFERTFGKELSSNKDTLVCSSSRVVQVFELLGLNRKAIEKRVPEWVYELPKEGKLKFLRGYLDADGTVNKKGAAIFASANRELIRDTKLLLDSLGFATGHIKEKRVRNIFRKNEIYVKKKESLIYEVEVSNPAKILKDIGSEYTTYRERLDRSQRYKDLQYKRKVPAAIDTNYFGFNSVLSVEKAGAERTYDIVVDGAHNFIADGVVVHNTLFHDDIEDDSEERRGKPCVHRIYGIPLAVNAGDVLLMSVIQQMLRVKNKKSQKILADNFILVGEGQAYDINWVRENRWNLTEKDYEMMVTRKTGVLIGAACAAGAVIGGADEKTVKILYEYGRSIGMAFQIQDDILNLIGDVKKYGKEIGGDITEAKRTLMVIHSLNRGSKEDRKRLIRILSAHTRNQKEIREAIGIMKRNGSIDYAIAYAKDLIEKSKVKLAKAKLKKNPSTKALFDFADFFINREY